MLDFTESFFKEEKYEDFTITSTMKHAWAAQLEVLSRIIDICERNNIEYYVFWGTLLGAIRHQGFIPWDDDIDLAMKREDYIRFISIATKELPNTYLVLNYYTEYRHNNPFTRITNSRNIDTSEEFLYEYHGCPFSVGIDIFPLDILPDSTELAIYQETMLSSIRELLTLSDHIDTLLCDFSKYEEASELRLSLLDSVQYIEESLGIIGNPKRPLKNRIYICFDAACMLATNNDGSRLTSMSEYSIGEKYIFDSSWFEPSYAQFENIKVCIPTNYDAILTELFGDYMTPIRVSAGHNYPFYKEQLAIMHQNGLWLDITE